MSDILVSNKLQMIDDIIEDGQKLRSLNGLIENYDLSIPFTAYRAAGKFAGNFYDIIGLVEPGEWFPKPCDICRGNFIRAWGSEAIFISEDNILCGACEGGNIEGLWNPDYKLWTLG